MTCRQPFLWCQQKAAQPEDTVDKVSGCPRLACPSVALISRLPSIQDQRALELARSRSG